MRKRMKRRIKIRKWVKVLITIFLIFTSIQLYYDLGVMGMEENKSTFEVIMLVLGWFWIIFGQIVTLSFIWED